MKIRVIAIIYTVLILGCGLYLWNNIGKKTAYKIDMLDLNTKCDEISDKLSSGADIDSLEKEYSCDIVLLSDDNYESVNNYFIKEDMSVFDYMEDGVIKGKIAFNARTDEHEALVRNSQSQLITMLALIYAAGMILLVIIWYFYIRPFNKLSSFAANVSKGNLDTPLNMDKHNYFGAFTESFDRMREELKLSSEREAAANRSKQELVAELSHDIKTPVATIKATCEVMEIKYKEPDIRDKVSVIKSKASSVEQLVDNLFRATLDDLEELKELLCCSWASSVRPYRESFSLSEEFFFRHVYSFVFSEMLHDFKIKIFLRLLESDGYSEPCGEAHRLLERVVDME